MKTWNEFVSEEKMNPKDLKLITRDKNISYSVYEKSSNEFILMIGKKERFDKHDIKVGREYFHELQSYKTFKEASDAAKKMSNTKSDSWDFLQYM